MAVPSHSGISVVSSLGEKRLDLLHIASKPITSVIADQVLCEALQTPPFVPIPGSINLRDIGQIPNAKIKPGLIYRSGNLSALQPSSVHLLATKLKLRTLFDFRQAKERERNPTPKLDGIEIVWIPSVGELDQAIPANFAANDGVDGFAKWYDSVLRVHANSYKTILEYLRDHKDEPILFHCNSGKDRTGVFAAILLTLVGHTPEEIGNDYSITRIGIESQRIMLMESLVQWLGEDAMDQPGVFELGSSNAKVMIGFLKFMDEKYGGPVGYCQNVLGLTKGELEIVTKNIMI